MSPPAPSVSIVIPIFREGGFVGKSLAALVAELDQYQVSHEILLIEQFSDAETLEESRAVAAHFPSVQHTLLPKPDFGAAMRAGMLAARGDLIVNFDIDYWDVTFVRMCLAMMLEFEIDLVIGSKNARLSVDNRAPTRRLISQAFRLVLQTVFGLRVSDTHGIKAWRNGPRLIEQIKACRYTRDVFDTELVIRGERAGFRMLELPVTVAEQRAPRSSILRRVPGAVWSLARLWAILQFEAHPGEARRGAITPRSRADSAPEASGAEPD